MADNMYSTENVPIRCIMTDGVVTDTKLFEQKVIRITYKIHILHLYMGLRIIIRETMLVLVTIEGANLYFLTFEDNYIYEINPLHDDYAI